MNDTVKNDIKNVEIFILVFWYLLNFASKMDHSIILAQPAPTLFLCSGRWLIGPSSPLVRQVVWLPLPWVKSPAWDIQETLQPKEAGYTFLLRTLEPQVSFQPLPGLAQGVPGERRPPDLALLFQGRLRLPFQPK